jgi:hypothetical protein
MGWPATALESLVKQCRGLQTTKWQSDEPAFVAFAAASLSLGDAYLSAAAEAAVNTGGSPSPCHLHPRPLSGAYLAAAAEAAVNTGGSPSPSPCHLHPRPLSLSRTPKLMLILVLWLS